MSGSMPSARSREPYVSLPSPVSRSFGRADMRTINVHLSHLSQTIKYGVITVDELCKDLIEWETLYCSGRMHKPVRPFSFLHCPITPDR